MDETQWRWRQDSWKTEGQDRQRSRRCRQDEGGFYAGRCDAVRLGLGLARCQGREIDRQQNAKWRESARSWGNADSRMRCLGTFLLYRLSQPAARLSQGIPGSFGELGLRRTAVRRGNKIIQAQRTKSRESPQKNPATDRRTCSPIGPRLLFFSSLRSSLS